MFIAELNHLLLVGDDLPTLPDIVFRLHAALDDDAKSDAQIADIIAGDPSLTTRLLRVSNSALYALGSEVTTVLGAMQRIGLRQVRGLCLVLSVVKSFSGGRGGLSHREFWNHCAAVGRIAHLLARRVPDLGPVPADDLYVAGLLHDIGLLILDQYFHEKFKEILEVRELSGDPLSTCEELVIGMGHGEIGGLLLGRWSLPQTIIDCVAAHERPESAPEPHQHAARVVHAAELLASANGAAAEMEDHQDADPLAVVDGLGIGAAQAQPLLAQFSQVREETQALLAS